MAAQKYDAIHSLLVRLPLVGIGVFLPLFLLSTYLYPGGSQADKLADGFSWMHNYWCNLLDEYAINGKPNPARPVAITAMAILCVSLTVFWYYLPSLFTFTRRGTRLIQLSGIGAMMSAMFLFTDYHDLSTTVSSVFGFVALVSTFVGLYKSRLTPFFRFGVACLFLMAANNYVYYTKHLLYYLPALQKVTFVCVLLWISLLTVKLHQAQVGRERLMI